MTAAARRSWTETDVADNADAPIRAAMIDALYGNIANQTLGGIATSAFLAAGAAMYSSAASIVAWLAGQGVLQVGRQLLRKRYARRTPGGSIEPWARAYFVYIVLQGLLWGATMWLFVHEENPLSLALTLSCLYAVVCGSIPGNAYHPPSGSALILLVFGLAVVRTVSIDEFAYIVVGIASFFFMLVVFSIARTQHRVLRDGIRIRFENVALLEQLRLERQEADTARQAAERANLAKSQFLAAASHDLRQPLYALGLFSSSLEELRLDSAARDVVRRIQDSLGAMEGTFEGLLDLSKLEAGIVAPRIGAVDVDALFDRINHVFGPLALERGIELRLRSDGEHVASDPALLEQVLSNLVSNAVRATGNGAVLLAARRRGGAVRFEVWDTGRGMAPEDLARIFDDYVQLDNPERDRRRGLGLGLAIARRSVALLDGTIAVTSRPGRGSCFRFSQPLVVGATQQPAPPLAEQVLRLPGGAPLLLVEDDEEVRAALGDLLGRWGIAFEAVADGETGLQRLTSGTRYSLLITDQRLSGALTGLDLLHAMHARMDDPPPAIIVTGEVDSPLLKEARQASIPVLQKPVRARQLRALLGVDDSLCLHEHGIESSLPT